MLLHHLVHSLLRNHGRTILHPCTRTCTNNNLSQRCYTMALTRQVSKSIPNAIVSETTSATTSTTTTTNNSNSNHKDGGINGSGISYERARYQNQQYLQTLRSIVPTLVLPEHIHNPSGDSAIETHDLPDCVFLEDTAITIGKRAVITRMGANSRRKEVDVVKHYLLRLGMDVRDMRHDEDATCDGGDVMRPISILPKQFHHNSLQQQQQQHVFVGLSDRTNEGGYEYLQRSFQDVPGVKVIPVPDVLQDQSASTSTSSPLHLKSVVSHIDERTLLVPTGPLGDELLSSMRALQLGYTALRLPDAHACNVLSLNGYVIAQPTHCDESKHVFETAMKQRSIPFTYTDASEFAKCDGALTCMSLLLEI
mmetsp:Transcript_14811/g.21181  ORF Transcript_14811/g.21181 Transcript_14811/m.21181 type:complete len:366 (-) Transcript_14811:81-1178(-)